MYTLPYYRGGIVMATRNQFALNMNAHVIVHVYYVCRVLASCSIVTTHIVRGGAFRRSQNSPTVLVVLISATDH